MTKKAQTRIEHGANLISEFSKFDQFFVPRCVHTDKIRNLAPEID